MTSSRVAQSARQYCASRLARPVGNWALPTVDRVGVNIVGEIDMSRDNDYAGLQVLHHKVSFTVEMHPIDDKRARAGAERQSMDFREFCALAIHRAALKAEEDL